MIVDGQSEVDDSDTLQIKIGDTQAVVDVALPWEFFEGMSASPMPGKALGIASIKAASGGKSEVCTCVDACTLLGFLLDHCLTL